MASAKGGSVPSEVRYGEGSPLPSRLEGLAERCELPQLGPGQSPGRKRILAYFEGHITLLLYLYDKIWEGQFALASPLQILEGTCPP